MAEPTVVTLDKVLSVEEEWRGTYLMIDMLEGEIFRQLGNFEDHNFDSLKIIQELVSSAKSIAKDQWENIHTLLKKKAAGVIVEH